MLFVCGLLFTFHQTHTYTERTHARNQKELQCKYHNLRTQRAQPYHSWQQGTNRQNKCKKTNFKVESNWRTSWISKIPSLIVNDCSTFFLSFQTNFFLPFFLFDSILFRLPWPSGFGLFGCYLFEINSCLHRSHTFSFVHGWNKHELKSRYNSIAFQKV